VGLLFGAFERDVARVVLLDARRPASFDALLSAATEVAPWLPAKVTFLRADIRRLPGAADEPQEEAAAEADERAARAHAPQHAPRADANAPDCFAGEADATAAAAALLAALPAGGAGFVALHACGALTDACLGVAIRARGAVAALPCCYTGTAAGVPPALRRALGVSMAADVARVYRMEREGFTADFAALPRAITPMNRALVAVPRQQPHRPASA
jgi:hypothetical protein